MTLGFAIIAALATGLAAGLYLNLRREQEQITYLRGLLRGVPENVKALNPPTQQRGGL
jgi:hypothetical protein